MMKIILSLLFIPVFLHAQASDGGSFGLGFVLGAPSGISMAVGNFQATLAYSFLDGGSFIGGADLKLIDQPLPGEAKFVNWYLGPGFLMEVFFSEPAKAAPARAKQSQLWLGIHAIAGLSWKFYQRWELFLEIGPGIYVFPAVNFLMTGGLGLRYYF